MIDELLRPVLAASTAALGLTWVWIGLVAIAPPPASPVAAQSAAAPGPTGGALHLDGRSALVVEGLAAPLDRFTAECWVRSATPAATQSLFGNTEDGGFEVVWHDSDGARTVPWPVAWLRTTRTLTSRSAGWTAAPSAEAPTYGAWTHLAVTCDGTRVRLFLDGRIVADAAVFGRPVGSDVPLVIGGDADEEGAPVDLFAGEIDEFRISRTVRYTEPFRPPAGPPAPDADTVLLLTFDDPAAPWRDSAGAHHVRAFGLPSVR